MSNILKFFKRCCDFCEVGGIFKQATVYYLLGRTSLRIKCPLPLYYCRRRERAGTRPPECVCVTREATLHVPPPYTTTTTSPAQPPQTPGPTRCTVEHTDVVSTSPPFLPAPYLVSSLDGRQHVGRVEDGQVEEECPGVLGHSCRLGGAVFS